MASRQRQSVETPEVRRRRLKAALRRERETAGLTPTEVAKTLDWSLSKIIRIEAGAVGLAVTDLRALLDLYGVSDEKLRAELDSLARGSRRQSWSQYSDVYSPSARALFGFEEAAKVIYKYEPTFIPGLLQTEEYAKALLLGGGRSEREAERIVRGRLERQEILERDPRPRLEFVIGEAALSRPVGGSGVMARQLQKLKNLGEDQEIFLQILLFEVGAHRRMGEAFTILEFADEDLDDLIYRENAGRESVSRDDPDLVADYKDDFLALQALALPASNLADSLDKIAATRLSLSKRSADS